MGVLAHVLMPPIPHDTRGPMAFTQIGTYPLRKRNEPILSDLVTRLGSSTR
jgi:hypothetical protein